MSNFLRNTLSTNAHWTVNKVIASVVGVNAAILLADLISKRSYFADRNQLEANGSFFNTTENIQDDTGLSERKRIAAQKVLTDFGLVSIEKRGLPARNYFTINDQAVFKIIDQGVVKPLPDDSDQINDSHDEMQSLQNAVTSHDETQSLVAAKRSDSPIYNKNKDNKNKQISESSPSSISSEDRLIGVAVQKIISFVMDRNMPTHEKTSFPSDVEARVISLRDQTLVEDRDRVITLLENMISDKLSNPKIEFLKDIAINLTREVWLGKVDLPPVPVNEAPAYKEPEHPLMQEFIRWAMTDEGKVRKHICTVEFYEEYKRLKERGEV